MNGNHFRYFLYARKSSESEDRQVASVPSQIDELKRVAKQYALNIIEVYTEEKSAKAPGRPIFTQMIEEIHKGHADGIICWKLDRLARNPIDGGTVSWMLQQSLIKHIQTFQRSYYPSDNVLMMNLEFGMANQFILDLSVNTKRGQKSLIEKGWFAHKPPIGYLTNKYKQPDKQPIYNDPINFPLMKKLWKMLLEKHYSLDRLYIKAREMGIKSHYGKILGRTTFYALFRNPFYYGSFYWNSELYKGKHKPMITRAHFDKVQNILEGRSFPRTQKHTFPFTGLMRCGECGASITAEHRTKHQKNGNINHYTYYHCTKKIDPNCSQRKVISEADLEKQITEVLETITIPPSFHQWAIKYLKEEHRKETIDQDYIIDSYQHQQEACRKKLNNLLNLRINGEIGENEFVAKKEEFKKEKQKYEDLIGDANHRVESWIDRAEELFNFAETAKVKFENGSLEDKRRILSCLGSNLLLKDKKLKILVDKPFDTFQKFAPEVQALHKGVKTRFEPLQPVEKQRSYEDLYSQNEKWGG